MVIDTRLALQLLEAAGRHARGRAVGIYMTSVAGRVRKRARLFQEIERLSSRPDRVVHVRHRRGADEVHILLDVSVL